MDNNRLRELIEERVTQVTEVGYFSPFDQTVSVYVPSFTKYRYPDIAVVHEELHHELTRWSEFGLFELGAIIFNKSVNSRHISRLKRMTMQV